MASHLSDWSFDQFSGEGNKAFISEKPKRRAGRWNPLVLLVLVISTVVPILILMAARLLHPYLALVLEMIMCYQLLAARSLRDESMKVYRALHRQDIEGARKAVSMIVGRDTERLDAAGIAKAAVETVAENASDGVIAPMIFIAIGGAPLGFFYKAVNTMDSMVGYKNGKYLYFGRAAANWMM